MVTLLRPYRTSGMAPTEDRLHIEVATDGEEIAPTYVHVPGGKKIAQYAPTVVGASVRYNPSANCAGNFTSSKFQVNNNCYNYACNVATNSFAQPGRMNGFSLISHDEPTGPLVVEGAKMDGLIWIGGSDLSIADLKEHMLGHERGHPVALLISSSDAFVKWPGDYHWVRCDKANCTSWSQKDGHEPVTNFDFAGNRIVDPAEAVWTVNQGPIIKGSKADVIVKYDFFGFMFVPFGRVQII
jgi:hypothetical protein